MERRGRRGEILNVCGKRDLVHRSEFASGGKSLTFFVLNQVRLDKQFCIALVILLIIIRQERGFLKYRRFKHQYEYQRPSDVN